MATKKKNWIQKVNKSIKKRGTKGKCTPITKKGCTGKAKLLLRLLKRWLKKEKRKNEFYYRNKMYKYM